ncbi:sodium- and chloride-dependent GABA transporter ine-like isoform X1 [Acipenser oxyrinchus oxyrinchus]|uniref:Sodium- and chloride-dependent GABA transporter ine-like isoform X1 n=1 Tax=Acipenser oxyrinchus oxyrinchus TaxID=40147 RepID=A0AAD8FQY9_ACIOX|nr:sodium- and chloride-dependent GABA transporter ine-like isoform X1 [Acipenser oxyrinchus oxyrinchus]
MASIIWIPLGAVHTLLTLKGSFKERLIKSVTPFSLDKVSKWPREYSGLHSLYPGAAVICTSFSGLERPSKDTHF